MFTEMKKKCLEVNLYMGGVQLQKVNILIFFKILFLCFQRGFGVLSHSWELKKIEQHFSLLPFPAALGLSCCNWGQRCLDPGLGSGQLGASVSLCIQMHGASLSVSLSPLLGKRLVQPKSKRAQTQEVRSGTYK